jgi:hypothetical protein
MALCLFEGRTPSVKPVPSQQEAMCPQVFRQSRLDYARQSGHVLIVFNDGQPLTMNVRPDSFETLEHLIAFNPQPMFSSTELRNDRAPDRVGVQNCIRLTCFSQDQVNGGLSRGLARPFQNFAARVHSQKVIGQETPLIQARRRDRQDEGVAANHRTEIAAGPKSPPPGITASPQFG